MFPPLQLHRLQQSSSPAHIFLQCLLLFRLPEPLHGINENQLIVKTQERAHLDLTNNECDLSNAISYNKTIFIGNYIIAKGSAHGGAVRSGRNTIFENCLSSSSSSQSILSPSILSHTISKVPRVLIITSCTPCKSSTSITGEIYIPSLLTIHSMTCMGE